MPQLADIKTAVSEAVTNCIVHAYPDTVGPITMTAVLYEGGNVRITISDKGVGIPDVAKAMEPMYTTGNPDERAGLGFAVMQSFMDRVHVSSAPGRGTRVTMSRHLIPGEFWRALLHRAESASTAEWNLLTVADMPAKTGTNQRLVAGQTFVPDCREAADMATANPTALLPHYRARSSSRKTLVLYIPVLAALQAAASNTKNCIRRAAWGLSKRAMGLTRTAGSVSPPMRCRSSWVRSKSCSGTGNC